MIMRILAETWHMQHIIISNGDSITFSFHVLTHSYCYDTYISIISINN